MYPVNTPVKKPRKKPEPKFNPDDVVMTSFGPALIDGKLVEKPKTRKIDDIIAGLAKYDRMPVGEKPKVSRKRKLSVSEVGDVVNTDEPKPKKPKEIMDER